MLRYLQRALMVLAFAGAAESALAFSLLGPYATWQTAALGYNPANSDIGGPMNIAEEYRWNVPTIYYGFDSSFKNYFGQRGMDEIRKAFAILNSLPRFSQMSSNLAEFPTDTRRVNYQASALDILDLKSHALAYLVEELGLASPERYVWTLRNETTLNNVTYYLVIKRNFDPVTLTPSSYVNGTLYTYAVITGIQVTGGGTFDDAIELPVDPLAFTFTAVVSAADGLWGGSLNAGDFFTGLTRDDVGALRYMYRPNNYNIENLLSNVTSSGVLPPWSPPGTNTNTIVTTALRPGLDKLNFVEAKYDSVFGTFITFTNTYTDTYVTNSALTSQFVQEAVTQPDILFTAEDLGVGAGGTPVGIGRTDTAGWANNAALNGQAALAGPGVIQPQVVITFNNVGPWILNASGTGISYMSEANPDATGWVWGSFDGTTNAPVVYPAGASIYDLEAQVLGGQ